MVTAQRSMDLSPGSSDVDLSIDLDSSVLSQVQKAIHRFAAATQQDSEVEDDGEEPLPVLNQVPPTRELSLEEKQYEYECQIRSLEDEVRLLEDELKRRDLPLDDIKDHQLEQAMLLVDQSDREGQVMDPPTPPSSGSPSTNVDDQHLEALRSQIRFSGAFNGVKFDSVSWEITQKDDNGLFRKNTHSGSSSGFTFQVQFIVREEKISHGEEDCIERAKVVALRAQVDPGILNEMQVFLKRVSSDCDLMTFYQTFVKCCHHVRERKNTLKKLKSRYGDRVSVSGGVEGTRMRFVFDNGCCLHFNWNVTVSELGQVDHSVSLQIKSSASVSEDQREGLSSLPHLLQKIMSIKGHSQGIVKFLSLLVDPASHAALET